MSDEEEFVLVLELPDAARWAVLIGDGTFVVGRDAHLFATEAEARDYAGRLGERTNARVMPWKPGRMFVGKFKLEEP